VAGLFDLQGPNLVIDADDRSVFEVLAAAERWLACGTADVMLACLLSTCAPAGDRADDAGEALVLSLATPAFARAHGWDIVGELVVGARDEEGILVRSPRTPATRAQQEVTISGSDGLAGFDDLGRALDAVAHAGATLLRWRSGEQVTPTPSVRATTAIRGTVR
jgi:hypothetical protein